jgi:hypothetical protein
MLVAPTSFPPPPRNETGCAIGMPTGYTITPLALLPGVESADEGGVHDADEL